MRSRPIYLGGNEYAWDGKGTGFLNGKLCVLNKIVGQLFLCLSVVCLVGPVFSISPGPVF